MAREILFKAKRKNNGKWVYGNYAFNDALGVKRHFIFQNYAYENEVDENTLCQFTGLLDNNKNKIFENDIVYLTREDEYFKVEWNEDTASFVMNGDGFTVTFDNYWSHEVEVYGSDCEQPYCEGMCGNSCNEEKHIDKGLLQWLQAEVKEGD